MDDPRSNGSLAISTRLSLRVFDTGTKEEFSIIAVIGVREQSPPEAMTSESTIGAVAGGRHVKLDGSDETLEINAPA